jgi:hypothetical protein
LSGCHASAIEIPRGDFAFHLLDNSALLNLTVLGDFLWAIAYILIIRQCFRQRSYGLPLVAIAMNFTWELQYSLLQPPRCDDGSVDLIKAGMILAWAALDAVIVWQLFRYGREEQIFPEIRRHFPIVVLASLVLAFIGNLTFAGFHPTDAAPLSGVIINFVMSVLFVFLVFARPGLRGISWSGALFRAAGNGLIFFANIFLLQASPPGERDFVLFLFAATAVFDVIYLALVYDRRRALPAGAPLPA